MVVLLRVEAARAEVTLLVMLLLQSGVRVLVRREHLGAPVDVSDDCKWSLVKNLFAPEAASEDRGSFPPIRRLSTGRI